MVRPEAPSGNLESKLSMGSDHAEFNTKASEGRRLFAVFRMSWRRYGLVGSDTSMTCEKESAVRLVNSESQHRRGHPFPPEGQAAGATCPSRGHEASVHPGFFRGTKRVGHGLTLQNQRSIFTQSSVRSGIQESEDGT